MSRSYGAADIEVLSGLDPVRRRPGMYTDTSRPNHLAHEVIDNSVDEAIAGHCKRIDVKLHKDGSLEVADDGRGMPVDKHPTEKIPGVELILTRLHAGGKFSDKNYEYAGGLHGVGVSVVNALSKNLEVWIRRDGKEYNLSFRGGKKVGKLDVVGKVGKQNTGTTIRFWPDPKYFDSDKISLPQLKHVLRAKAVLCPGLVIRLRVEKPAETVEWQYEGGLEQYLLESTNGAALLPEAPFDGSLRGTRDEVEWAVAWTGEGAPGVAESYVNLVPTAQGGTHVNGFRSGLTEALREYCDFRSLLPRGVRLAPEDVWDGVVYVLSVKTRDPQFSGQTKERLSSREVAAFVSGAVKDAFGIWLNQHPETGDQIAQRAIAAAQKRLKAGKQGGPQEDYLRAGAAGQAGRLQRIRARTLRAVPGRRRFRRRIRKAGARSGVPGSTAPARQDPEHLGGRSGRAHGFPGSPQHQPGARYRARLGRLVQPAIPQGVHPC